MRPICTAAGDGLNESVVRPSTQFQFNSTTPLTQELEEEVKIYILKSE